MRGHLRLIEGGPSADEPRPALPGYAGQMAAALRLAAVQAEQAEALETLPAPRKAVSWHDVGIVLEELALRLCDELGIAREDIPEPTLSPAAELLLLFACRRPSSPPASPGCA